MNSVAPARFTAVASSDLLDSDKSLKQVALLFDQVVVFDMGTWLWSQESAPEQSDGLTALRAREVEWLRSEGLIVDPDPRFSERLAETVEFSRRYQRGSARTLDPDVSFESEADRLVAMAKTMPLDDLGVLWRRLYAAVYNQRTGNEAAILGQGANFLMGPAQESKHTVASVVLRTLPQPDDATPWEAVFEFRADPVARGRFFNLKNWMNRLASSEKERSASDLEEELRSLLFDYESQLRLHHLKFSSGVLQTILTTSAGCLENLLTLRWSKAAQALVGFRHERVQLLEAERNTAGRELAYIVEANRAFHSQQAD